MKLVFCADVTSIIRRDSDYPMDTLHVNDEEAMKFVLKLQKFEKIDS